MTVVARRFGFEFMSLAVMGAGVVMLYAMVLGGPTARSITADPTVASTPPPPPLAPPRGNLVAFRAGDGVVSATGSVAMLDDLFHKVDYRLEDVRLGELAVPRILVDSVPVDLAAVESVAERKRLFIQLALPLILYANERILADRKRLIGLAEEVARDGAAADALNRAWLHRLALRYGLETVDFSVLLRRVDVVPPSLALAQAAEESGWGTSRFVREGNAIFGQRTFDQGAGLVPERRDSDKTHEVRAFSGLVESVASYMTNLNTHFAYQTFRRLRQRQRLLLGRMDAFVLAGALDRYSERGAAYIETIRAIIRTNNLRAYDRARLNDGDVLAGIAPNI